MKHSLLFVGAATTLMIAWCIGRMQGQQDQKVIFVSADHANFQETPTKGVSMAAICSLRIVNMVPPTALVRYF